MIIVQKSNSNNNNPQKIEDVLSRIVIVCNSHSNFAGV